MTEHKVKGVPPDMTFADHWAVLREASSPVSEGEARAVYDYCVQRGLSVAFLTAMFKKESTFGRFGSAATTHSYGNTRPPSYGVPHLYVTDRTFSAYANWADGGISTVARLFDHPAYQGKDTIEAIIPVWAPPVENATDRYITQVIADFEKWSQPQGGSVPKPPVDASHPSPNRGGYPHAHDARCVVWHITQGTNSLGWLTNPASGASSNYLIRRDGWIYELVPPTVSAWANGRVCFPDRNEQVVDQALREGRNLNTVSVSIEHEGFTSAGRGGSLTQAQSDATVALTAWLCATFGIPPTRDGIIGHFAIDSCDRPNCPGFSQAEWAVWVARVAAMVNGAPDTEGGIYAAATALWDDGIYASHEKLWG